MQGKRSNPYYVAQDILSRRGHAEDEVRQKLARKRFTKEQIEEVITWLKEQRLLNDRVFAQNYAESMLRLKAVGPRWLRSKLLHKGVSSEIVQEVVRDVFTAQDEGALLTLAADRWRAAHRGHAHDTQRLKRFLLSRGFSFAAIDNTLREEH